MVRTAILLLVLLVAFNQAINTSLVPKKEVTNLAQVTADQQTMMEAEADLIQGVRLVLKRRQKYMYDYFFPKNMRDLQEK